MRPYLEEMPSRTSYAFPLLLLAAWGTTNQIDLVSPAFQCRCVSFFSFLFFLSIFHKSELSLWSLRHGRTCAFSSSFEGYIPARVDLFWTTGGRWSHRTCMAFTVGGRPSGALSTGLAMEKVRGFRLSFMILGKWRAPTRGGGLWTNYLRAPGSDNDFG